MALVAQYEKNKGPNQNMGRRPKLSVLQRRHTDGQLTREKMSTSFIIREMKIKPTVRYYFTSIRMVIIKKELQTINAGESVEKRDSYCILVGMQIGTATMENRMEIL